MQICDESRLLVSLSWAEDPFLDNGQDPALYVHCYLSLRFLPRVSLFDVLNDNRCMLIVCI